MSDETAFPLAVIGHPNIPCGTILQGGGWHLGFVMLVNPYLGIGGRIGIIPERFILMIKE